MKNNNYYDIDNIENIYIPEIIFEWLRDITERRKTGYTRLDRLAGYEYNDNFHYDLILKNYPKAIEEFNKNKNE